LTKKRIYDFLISVIAKYSRIESGLYNIPHITRLRLNDTHATAYQSPTGHISNCISITTTGNLHHNPSDHHTTYELTTTNLTHQLTHLTHPSYASQPSQHALIKTNHPRHPHIHGTPIRLTRLRPRLPIYYLRYRVKKRVYTGKRSTSQLSQEFACAEEDMRNFRERGSLRG
jgi:hypothetical protein